MQITVSSKIRIHEPRMPIKKWVRDHLILQNPEYVKKARMGLYTGNVPQKVFLFEVRDDDLILPYGCLKPILEMSREHEVVSELPEPKHVDFNCKVPLYDYQRKAVEEMKKGYYGILQSPAGSGKTQMGIALVAELGVKTLWLTHTLDLVSQSKNRAAEYMDKSLLGEISHGKVDIGRGITFATVQTMSKLDLDDYDDEWDCVVVDECHRVAGTPARMTQFYKVLNKLKARHKFGLSATVHRSDGMIEAAYALLGEIVYTVPQEATADRVMKVDICPIATNIGASDECLNSDGTINFCHMINYLAENEARNKLIAERIVDNKESPCLILSDRIGQLETLMNSLPARMKAKAVMITGGSKRDFREQALEDMQKGKKKYLFATYQLAKEGLDVPCLERLFLVTPHSDYAVIVQSIGRIARTYPGKEDPLAFDFVDNIGYLIKAYKKRCWHYRKIQCGFREV